MKYLKRYIVIVLPTLMVVFIAGYAFVSKTVVASFLETNAKYMDALVDSDFINLRSSFKHDMDKFEYKRLLDQYNCLDNRLVSIIAYPDIGMIVVILKGNNLRIRNMFEKYDSVFLRMNTNMRSLGIFSQYGVFSQEYKLQGCSIFSAYNGIEIAALFFHCENDDIEEMKNLFFSGEVCAKLGFGNNSNEAERNFQFVNDKVTLKLLHNNIVESFFLKKTINEEIAKKKEYVNLLTKYEE